MKYEKKEEMNVVCCMFGDGRSDETHCLFRCIIKMSTDELKKL